jgi:hypothetical protein
MSSSKEYIPSLKVRTRRSVFLYVACFVVGTVVGGFVVRATRPHRDDATVISALAGGAATTAVTPTTAPVSPSPSGDLERSCNAPESPRSAVATIDEFRTLIVRSWMLCSAPSVFGSKDEIGLELLSDATWYKLYASDDGTVARGLGFGRRGTWEIVDSSAMSGRPLFHINLSVFGSGTVITSPIFTADPMKMRMNNMGLFVADYVAVD